MIIRYFYLIFDYHIQHFFQAGSIRLSFGAQGLQRFLELVTVKEFTVLPTLYDTLLIDDKKISH